MTGAAIGEPNGRAIEAILVPLVADLHHREHFAIRLQSVSRAPVLMPDAQSAPHGAQGTADRKHGQRGDR
jgi:hypothetical protein